VDSKDPLAAMEACYRYGVENDLFKLTPAATTARRISEANTPEELRAALGRDPYAVRN
jgi:hypothetical protein